MATQQKLDLVKNITEKVKEAKSIVFTDYSKLTHKQLEELRKNLKKVQGIFIVSKNSLLKRALTNINKVVNDTQLLGATGILLSQKDEIAPIKILVNFLKTTAVGTVKGGLLGTTPLSSDEVTKLSTIPARIELYGKLVGSLQAPIYGLHHALSWNIRKLVWTLYAVKDKHA